MIACITTTLLINLTSFYHGSVFTVRADTVESYQIGQCHYLDYEGGFFSVAKSHLESCTYLRTKSGNTVQVKETPAEILKLLENKNGK